MRLILLTLFVHPGCLGDYRKLPNLVVMVTGIISIVQVVITIIKSNIMVTRVINTREAINMIWNARRLSSSCSSYKMSQGEESTLQTRCCTKIKLILIIIIIIIINIVDIGLKILTDRNI